jgi:hypothetical protein
MADYPAAARVVRLAPVWGLVVLVALMATLRYHYYDWPPNRDVTEYAVTAHELLQGRELYSDVWNPKPPAVFVSYGAAELLFGYGPGQLYALNLICGLIVLLGVYAAGPAGGFRPAAGLWAAAFWTVISGNIALQTHGPNTEAFMNACLIWAFVLLLGSRGGAFGARRAVVIGLLFAWASLYKQVAIAIAIPLLAAHVALPPPGTQRRNAVVETGIVAAVGVGCWTMLVAFMAATGRTGILIDTLIIHGATYVSDLPAKVLEALSSPDVPWKAFGAVLVPLVLVGAVGVALGLTIRGNRRNWLLLAVYGAGAAVAVALPGQFYRHYFQFLLPPALVAMGWATVSIGRILNGRWAWVPHGVAALVLLFVAANEVGSYRSSPEESLRGAYAERYLAARELGRRMDSLLLPGETLYHLGNESGIYFHSRRPLPTTLLGWSLWSGPLADRFTRRTLDDLERQPPDVVVVPHDLPTSRADHPVVEWIVDRYVFVNGLDELEARHFSLLAERGSPTAERLTEPEVIPRTP